MSRSEKILQKIRRYCFLLVIFPTVGLAAENSEKKDFGLGVMVGNQTSIIGKWWTAPRRAIEAAAGGNNEREGWLQVSYVTHFDRLKAPAPESAQRFASELVPYSGFGGGIGFNREIDDEKEKNDYYLRIPIGLSWFPRPYRVDLFAEAAPTWTVAPKSLFYLQGALGGRFYF